MEAWKYLGIAYIVMSLIGFCLMGADKKRAANNQWRIKEATLFLFAALGGGIGSTLGMFAFRHKTKHLKFTIGVPVILMLQIIVPLGLWVYWRYFR